MSETQPLAVVIEPDSGLRERLAAQLQRAATHRVAARPSCDDALAAQLAEIEGGLLVVGMRDPRGRIAGLVRHCRDRAPGVVILVIDHADDADSVGHAFAAGADDVLRPGFAPGEFAARLELRLRQAAEATARRRELQEAFLTAAGLTPVETEIVRLLFSNKGGIVTRNQLSRHLDDCDWIYGDRKFDVHITKIRKKLQAVPGPRYTVRTIRSEGYVLDTETAAVASA